MTTPELKYPSDDLPENQSSEILIQQAHQTVKRIISLCLLDDQTEITEDIILDGELLDEHTEQKAIWNSAMDNGLGLVIKRYGGIKNDETEIQIFFYPYNYDQTNLLENIEAGLADEWAERFEIEREDAIIYMEKELKRRGPKGMSLACLKISYERDKKAPENSESMPKIAELSLSLADDTTIKFNPLKTEDNINQNKEVYKNTVYKRLLDRLETCLIQEETSALQQVFSVALTRPPEMNQDLNEYLNGNDDDTKNHKPPNPGTKILN